MEKEIEMAGEILEEQRKARAEASRPITAREFKRQKARAKYQEKKLIEKALHPGPLFCNGTIEITHYHRGQKIVFLAWNKKGDRPLNDRSFEIPRSWAMRHDGAPRGEFYMLFKKEMQWLTERGE